MQNQQLQPLKGFRDFLPQEKILRDQMMGTIKQTFARHGFLPLETPTLEYASLLLGKYGKDADQLVYSFTDRGGREVALRYDQTVPSARVLSQYKQQLGQYFRRYQIQNVYRADKPQAGRYREFVQCDADIFDSISPVSDAEILSVFYDVYQDLGVRDFTIEYNDRNALISTLKSFASEEVKVESIIQTIDKLDKLELSEVVAELISKGLPKARAESALATISNTPLSDELGRIIDLAKELGVPSGKLVYNPMLARGLDYYTGLIFEAKLKGKSSLGGGGRYDNLIKSLGGPDTAAVGFGIGFDRTIEALIDQGLTYASTSTKILVTCATESLARSLSAVSSLRGANIATDLYPEPSDKLEKQLKYADRQGIPFVLIADNIEVNSASFILKNMAERTQSNLSLPEIVQIAQNA